MMTVLSKCLLFFLPCNFAQIISSSSGLHISKDQGPRRSKFTGREGHTTSTFAQHHITCHIRAPDDQSPLGGKATTSTATHHHTCQILFSTVCQLIQRFAQPSALQI